MAKLLLAALLAEGAEGAHPVAEHAAPAAFGVVTAPVVVAIAMTLVVLLLVAKKVPAAIGKSLDAKIALIRDQLAEAEALRKDAEALKAEYAAKTAAADREMAAMIKRAETDAKDIVAKADADAKALVARRKAMAEAKIAAEERAAIDALKRTAAEAARKAAERLIAEGGDAKADKAMVDKAIAGI